MNVGDRRACLVYPFVFDGITKQGSYVLLQFWIRVLQHRSPIDYAKQVHSRRPDIGSLANRHQCHEPSVGGATNANLLRIDVTRRLQKLGCIHFVLQISATEILIVGSLKIHSVSSRSAYIRRDAEVAA